MLVDLHVYTNLSGGLPLPRAIEAARKDGLEGICIADRQASSESAKMVLDGAGGDFPVFVAVEIPTRLGDMIFVAPDLDPFYTREEWRQLTALHKPSIDDVLALADELGGAVLLTQPYDSKRRVRAGDRFFSLDAISGVELATAGADPRSNALSIEAVSHAQLPKFAGSAARKGAASGSGWATLFSKPFSTQADFVKALRGGEFWPVELSDRLPQRGGRGSGGGGGGRSGGGGGRRGGGGGGRRRRG